jgi:KaiC/GvpD/RAD55 family RecA-like ATPase
MASEKRISTGVPKLDKILDGGYLPGSCILVSGEAGSGKTIFGAQFLNAGIEKKESVLYITTEESPKDIIKDAKRFGWDFSSFLISIEMLDPTNVENIEDILRKKIVETNAKRVVVDSLTIVGSFLPDISSIRKKFYSIKKTLKDLKVTSLLISEVEEGGKAISRFGVEEFIVDGVIVLRVDVDVTGGTPRNILVRKMKGTRHDLDFHPIEIDDKGIDLV